MPLTVEDFKSRFKKSAAKKFNRREAKIDEALADLLQACITLEQAGGNSKRFRAMHTKLTMKVGEAEEIGTTNPKKGYKLLADIKEAARKQAAMAQTEVDDEKYAGQVNVQGLDRPLKVHAQSLPGVKELTDNERQELFVKVGQKMGAGKQLLDTILSSDNNALANLPNPGLKEITDLVWYVKGLAEEKVGDAYLKGSLTIPDPDNKLRQYIDRCAEIYTRSSSHLSEEQGNNFGKARGIDMYGGSIDDLDTMLPYGMNTLLTQTARGSDGESMLFIKTETESAFIDPHPFLKDDQSIQNLETRKMTKSDVGNSIAHLGNLVKAKLVAHEDGSLASFREQTPAGVLNAYAAVITAAKRHDSKEAVAVLKEGFKKLKKKQKKKGGDNIRIKTIIENFEAVKKLAEEGKVDDETIAAIAECEKRIVSAYGSEGLENRFGSEVQLNLRDLGGMPPQNDNGGRVVLEDFESEMELVFETLDSDDEEEGSDDGDDNDTEEEAFDLDNNEEDERNEENWMVLSALAESDPLLFGDELLNRYESVAISKEQATDIRTALISKHFTRPDFSTLPFEEAQVEMEKRQRGLKAIRKLQPKGLAFAALSALA